MAKNIICEYEIWCPKCEYKSATWQVDGPHAKDHVKGSFVKQYDAVTFPDHAEHGTITIVEERTHAI